MMGGRMIEFDAGDAEVFMLSGPEYMKKVEKLAMSSNQADWWDKLPGFLLNKFAADQALYLEYMSKVFEI